MNKDFVLITGHGIFPAASILQVVPVTDVSFEVSVTPPLDETGEFIFSVVKNVSVNVEIARANPTKKNDVEILTDYGYTRPMSDQYDFRSAEFLSMLELSDDDTVKEHIKSYTRRLKKYGDYQKAITAIESNPDVPDYEASLAAVKQNAPGDSYIRKQEKTTVKLRDYLLEKFLSAVENASDDDEDYTGKKLIDIINSDESQDAIEFAATAVLKSFYNKNFGDGLDFDDEDEEGDDTAEQDYFDLDDSNEDSSDSIVEEQRREQILNRATQDLERADAIRTSPDTISNVVKGDEDEG